MAIKVVVKNNNVEKALSIFKRKVKDSNMMYELREREFFKKKSDPGQGLSSIFKDRSQMLAEYCARFSFWKMKIGV